MDRIAVLGAGGFIGSSLCRKLSDMGFMVYAFYGPHANKIQLDSNNVKASNIDLLHLDTREYMQSVENISECDYLYIASWLGINSLNNFDIHKRSKESLLKLLTDVLQGGKFKGIVQLGSQAEYGIHSGEVVSEESDCFPVNEYGKFKLEFYWDALKLCTEYDTRFVEYRLHSIYGKNRKGGVLNKIIGDLKKLGCCELKSNCIQYFDYLYVNDCVNALLTALDKSLATGVYNVGSGMAYRLYEFFDYINQTFFPKSYILYGESKQIDSPDFVYDISKLRKYSKWRPNVSFEEGIREMVNL